MIEITIKISYLREEFLSSVSECRACYPKVPGSTPDGGIFILMDNFTSSCYSVNQADFKYVVDSFVDVSPSRGRQISSQMGNSQFAIFWADPF